MPEGKLIRIDFQPNRLAEDTDIELGARAVAALERAIHERREHGEIESLRHEAETILSRVPLEDYRSMYKRASQIQDELTQSLK